MKFPFMVCRRLFIDKLLAFIIYSDRFCEELENQEARMLFFNFTCNIIDIVLQICKIGPFTFIPVDFCQMMELLKVFCNFFQ